MWVAIAYQVIAAIIVAAISYALMPKQKAPPGAKAQTITSPTVDAGTPIQVPFGRIRIRNPNLLWYGGDRTVEIKK